MPPTLDEWILANPEWTEWPIRVWFAIIILVWLFLVWRRGWGGAANTMSRLRWPLIGSFIVVAAWSIYGMTVLGTPFARWF